MKGRAIRIAIPKTGVRSKDQRIGENNNFLTSLFTATASSRLRLFILFKDYDCGMSRGKKLVRNVTRRRRPYYR